MPILDPLADFDYTPFNMEDIISPITGQLGSGFGDMRDKGARRHHAYDLPAPAGTPLIAPTDMEFIQGGVGGKNLRPNDRWAHFKIPGTNYEWRVAHQGEIPEAGTKFTKGQTFGTVGNVINDPHLHTGLYNTATGEYEDWAGNLGLKKGAKLFAGHYLPTLGRRAGAVAANTDLKDPLADFYMPTVQQDPLATKDPLANVNLPQAGTEKSVEQPQVDMSQFPPGTPVMKAGPMPPDEQLPPQNRSIAPLGTLINAASVDSPRAKIKTYAKNRFPNLPLEQAQKRYWVDRNNDIVYMDDTGKINPEIPSGILNTGKKVAADVIGHPLELVGGLVGTGLLGPFGTSLGAAGGGLLRKGLNAVSGIEPTSAADLAGNAATDLFITGLMSGPFSKGLLVDAPNNIIGRLSPGSPRKINIPDLKWIRGIDEKINTAINRELDAIAPGVSAPGRIAQDAARDIKSSIKEAREAAAAPQYRAAFQSGAEVDIQPVLDELSSLRQKYSPTSPRTAALNKIEGYLTAKDVDPEMGETVIRPIRDLEKLHEARVDITGLLKTPAGQEGAVPSTIRGNVTNLRSRLTDILMKASPEYKEATETYRTFSKPLNKFKYGDSDILPAERTAGNKSLMGKIEALGKTESVENAVGLVFSDRPENIAKARQWYQINHPDAWNTLVRSRLQQKLESVSDTVAEGQAGFKFKHSVFGSSAEQDKWRAALSENQYKQISKFMDVLDETQKIKFTGDAASSGGKSFIRTGFGSTLQGTFSVMDYWNPIAAVGRKLDKVRVNKFTSALSDALLDTSNLDKLTKLNLISDKKRQAVGVAGFLNSIWMASEGKELGHKLFDSDVPREPVTNEK